MSREAFSFDNLNNEISKYNEGIKNQDKDFLSWLDNSTQKPQLKDSESGENSNGSGLYLNHDDFISDGGPGDYFLVPILSLAELFGDALFGRNRNIRQEAISHIASKIPGMYSAQLVNIWMQGGDISAKEWFYGAVDYVSVFGGPATSTIRFEFAPLNLKFSPFGLRGGYGVFGKSGLSINGYKIEAMYANPRGGPGAGTILSIKQMKPGGALWRWDYGINHATGGMGFHSTVRFHWNDIIYGNTAQRTWYPSSFKAPFFKPLR